MNKYAKGSIAAGAAVLLLLGGAGTLAFWNDQANLTGANIAAGELTLDATACDWDGDDIALWVPGDSASCEAELTLEAKGDNIKGVLAIDDSGIVVDPVAAADQFDIDLTAGAATVVGGPGVFNPVAMTFTGAGTYTIPVTVTIDFEFRASEQNISQNATVELGDVEFTVTQTAP